MYALVDDGTGYFFYVIEEIKLMKLRRKNKCYWMNEKFITYK